MSSLKSLRIRINSIRSTRKMTQAMKLVSASKLRRSKEVLDGGRPYFRSMDKATITMLQSINDRSEYPIAFGRQDNDSKALIIAFGSDKGLCGSFNINLVKKVKQDMSDFAQEGMSVEVMCVGKKVYDLFKHLENEISISYIDLNDKDALKHFAEDLTQRFHEGLFDSCYVYFNHFISAMSQEIQKQRLIPLFRDEDIDLDEEHSLNQVVECLPDAGKLILEMAPKILLSKILSVFQESQASENGARMTCMDNATRNAGEMIKKLNTIYNRTRQAAVTTELIEILAGAEAIKSN